VVSRGVAMEIELVTEGKLDWLGNVVTVQPASG
jgi:hypothetical protein